MSVLLTAFVPAKLNQPLEQALEHHRSGRLDQAELLYRRILDEVPDHSDALHLLGVVAHQRGRHRRAIELIGKAVSLDPRQAAYHGNLSEACRAAGDLPQAEVQARLALNLQPGHAAFCNSLGLALQAQGRHGEALPQFQEAVRREPGFALAHNNLGITLREIGRLAEALDAFRAAVRLDPASALAQSNLGQMLLEHNQVDEALAHCQEAVRLQPEHPEALNNLGNVLRRLGRLEEAKSCYDRVLQLQPGQAMAQNNLGQALQEEGQLDEALACYQQALSLEPRSARFHCNLASLLRERERDDEALEHCRLAFQLDPAYAEGHHLLGSLLREQGDLAGAEAAFREALRLRPESAESRVSLGHLLEERGSLEQALATFREALRHDPRNAAAYGGLATALRGRMPDDELAAAERLLQTPIPPGARAGLQSALAQALDGRGRYAEAAEMLRLANARRAEQMERRGRAYDPAEHTRFVDMLIAQFSPEYFRRVHGWGLDTELPVFVIGLPRSATTLTEQILASHPQVFGAGELRYMHESFDSFPGLLKSNLPAVESPALYEAAVIHHIAAQHLERLRRLHPDATRVVDKLPDNYLYAGLIATLFPKARIVHCRRDVRDTALSCWMTNFKQITWACDLRHIAGRIREYQRLMEHWRRVLPVPMLEVDYEETVADLQGVARRLVRDCGLEWDPACLSFHENTRPVRTASVTQVRQPIYTRSVQRWRHYADALAPLLQELGHCQRTTGP